MGAVFGKPRMENKQAGQSMPFTFANSLTARNHAGGKPPRRTAFETACKGTSQTAAISLRPSVSAMSCIIGHNYTNRLVSARDKSFIAQSNSDFVGGDMFPEDDSAVAVAARLTKIREILGLTKREFAEKAGLSEQQYGPYENAKRDLSLFAAKKLRSAYSLPLDFIFFGNIDDLPHKIAKHL